MSYGSKGDTLEHIRSVQSFINSVIRCLMDRAKYHDASKLKSPDKKLLTHGSRNFQSLSMAVMNTKIRSSKCEWPLTITGLYE